MLILLIVYVCFCWLFLEAELQCLRRQVTLSRRAAFAEGTNKNLMVQYRAFLLFCLYYNLPHLPTNADTVALYVQFLKRTFVSMTSVKNYINRAKTLHLTLGLPFPEADYSFRLLIKGLTRLHPHEEKRALPITPVILLKLYDVMDLTQPLHASLWCCFLTAFFLFARKSTMLPPTPATFSIRKHLTRGNFSRSEEGLLVLVKWSKTLQFGERHLLVPLLVIPGSVLCPCRAFDHMVSLIPADKLSPAFLHRVGTSWVSVGHTVFVNNLRALLRLAGVDARGYTGHSFRRGGASCAFDAGVSGELIKMHGDWRSDAYLKYLSVPMHQRAHVCHRMRRRILCP